MYDKYGLKGDKYLCFRNDLLQKYEYPLYSGEKFGGDELVFNWINDEYPMWILRKIVAHRDYMPDSITNNLLKNHLLSSNGMTDHYNEQIRVERYNKKNIIKHCIGYIGYSILSKRNIFKILKLSNRKPLTVFLLAPGIIYGFRLMSIKKKL